MKKILRLYIFIICIIILFMLIDIRIRTKKILNDLNHIEQSLDYIDTRMDTLEFYRVPEVKKRVK